MLLPLLGATYVFLFCQASDRHAYHVRFVDLQFFGQLFELSALGHAEPQ